MRTCNEHLIVHRIVPFPFRELFMWRSITSKLTKFLDSVLYLRFWLRVQLTKPLDSFPSAYILIKWLGGLSQYAIGISPFFPVFFTVIVVWFLSCDFSIYDGKSLCLCTKCPIFGPKVLLAFRPKPVLYWRCWGAEWIFSALLLYLIIYREKRLIQCESAVF